MCALPQNEDGTYTGFIKVHLKLRRPVTVPAGIRPQSIYDALKEVNLAEMTDKRTSFYLPLDAIKQLHISSTTTVSEVIQGLLKKFMVVDNPQKFALFKEMRKDGQGEFGVVSLVSCRAHWGGESTARPPQEVMLLELTGNYVFRRG